jgi:RNA polymerase sigma factor (sigma-70 family)
MAGLSPQSPRDRADASQTEFELFYQAEMPRLMSYLILCGTDRDDAEDAVQYAFVQLLHQWQTVHVPTAWLRKVAFRKALQMRARNDRPLEPGYDRPGGQPASERIEHDEEAHAVLGALSRLPITQRKVAALIYDEYGINEIGEMLGMTDAAVRQNLSRARRRLRDQLGSILPVPASRQAA